MDTSEKNIAEIFKALGDPNRILILKALRNGETCCCHLLEQLQISQPTLSHHMKILCDAGIVTGRKDGKWVHYSINCEGACRIRQILVEITSPEQRPANCRCGNETDMTGGTV